MAYYSVGILESFDHGAKRGAFGSSVRPVQRQQQPVVSCNVICGSFWKRHARQSSSSSSSNNTRHPAGTVFTKNNISVSVAMPVPVGSSLSLDHPARTAGFELKVDWVEEPKLRDRTSDKEKGSSVLVGPMHRLGLSPAARTLAVHGPFPICL